MHRSSNPPARWTVRQAGGAALLAWVMALSPVTARAQPGDARLGLKFAEQHCARCHAILKAGNSPEKLAKIAKINTFHVSLFAEFLQRMKATPDGDGSLLDHTVYLYGSGMGNPSLHDHENLPILVAGGAATGLKGGRHIKYDKGMPLANVHLTLLDRVGVHLDSFGDSSGKVEDLFDPVAL